MAKRNPNEETPRAAGQGSGQGDAPAPAEVDALVAEVEGRKDVWFMSRREGSTFVDRVREVDGKKSVVRQQIRFKALVPFQAKAGDMDHVPDVSDYSSEAKAAQAADQIRAANRERRRRS